MTGRMYLREARGSLYSSQEGGDEYRIESVMGQAAEHHDDEILLPSKRSP